jgi:poly(3-hydroxybutyrate) depolymerase
MNWSYCGPFSLGSLIFAVACSSSPSDGDAPRGGAAGTAAAGTSASAGSPAGVGGSAPGGGGTAQVAGGPATAGSGDTTVGGASSGGASAGASNAGASNAGASSAGASNGGAGGGTSRPVKPSAGCSKGSTQVTIPNSLVGVPTGYTGKDPVPVVIAFHAAGNDNTSIQNTFKSSDLAKKYLMVYPNSTSATTSNKTGWSIQADKTRYTEVQAAVLSQACVDENRIYATGHSSGAQFVVSLLCSGDADFDAVAPVASSVYCQKWKNGPVPSLVIHGVKDEERTKYNLNDGDGKKDLQPYLTSNMCQMTTTPFTPDVSKCNNIQGIDGKAFNPGCVEFAGCSVKTRWCNHNDPNYGTTNHGIPCFGVRAIYDFFESL